VYVGKHARSNQELTFAFARPNDYFFHIRSYEGAHVILRAKIPRGQRPNKRDIDDAASIAAYFSKAKKQKNVPVSYTQRKYLKRNRKGKLGSVILMREDVVFVDPGLPLERNV
jgi:predicted ribosome quality control (RQC) complex YloA/Tae2 family protein